MEIHNFNSRPSTPRRAALTLKAFNSQTLNPEIPVYLPWNLTAREFQALISTPEESSILFPDSQPYFSFPALRHWLSRLLNTLSTQNDPTRSPYTLRSLDIEAVDWFFPGRLGFMKLQSSIENDEAEGSNWIPGAVFLRGRSVAVLARLSPTPLHPI
ncbi:NUDIX family hydrolase [Pyrenophora seminiperda CCB06]|uniref:NUDIX family hydrolase n=1 Tax=Pyrenophora seminiperda CCB06 TaxID=1302712 RepID=A0A3M7M061_9PLEO|nr:NUDIX family hydrolase [Pyrenophora seminiperda CCB06]